jgi:hypothetical protein
MSGSIYCPRKLAINARETESCETQTLGLIADGWH